MNDHEKTRQYLIKTMFSKKKYRCAECKARLNDSNRRRMVGFARMPQGVLASPYQLCMPCGDLFEAQKYHLLPNISKDMTEAQFQFIGADVECVGGVQ